MKGKIFSSPLHIELIEAMAKAKKEMKELGIENTSDYLLYKHKIYQREINFNLISSYALRKMKVGQTFGFATLDGLYRFKLEAIEQSKELKEGK